MRTSLVLALGVVGTLTLAATDAVASGGGGGGAGIPQASLFRHLVNLLVLLTILYMALRTAVSDFLKFRRDQVAEQLETSWAAKAKAEARYAELQGRLDNFETEVDRLLTVLRSDADAERARLIEEADKASTQLEAAAHRSIEEEIRRTRLALRSAAVDQAIRLARETLNQQVGTQDHHRLADAYVAKMQERAGS